MNEKKEKEINKWQKKKRTSLRNELSKKSSLQESKETK